MRFFVTGFVLAVCAVVGMFLYGPPGHKEPSSTILDMGGGHCTAVHIGDGYFLTAAHCTANPGAITLGEEGDIVLRLWAHDSYDVALVHVENPTVEREAAPIRCSKPVIGEPIYTVGNPVSFRDVWLWGRVSGTSVSIQQWRIAVPVSLAVAGGSSGGPVFDAEGNLLGIVTATPVHFGGLSLMTPTYAVCPMLGHMVKYVD